MLLENILETTNAINEASITQVATISEPELIACLKEIPPLAYLFQEAYKVKERIDVTSLHFLLSKLKIVKLKSETRECFKYMDKDGDGKIGPMDFLSFFQMNLTVGILEKMPTSCGVLRIGTDIFRIVGRDKIYLNLNDISDYINNTQKSLDLDIVDIFELFCFEMNIETNLMRHKRIFFPRFFKKQAENIRKMLISESIEQFRFMKIDWKVHDLIKCYRKNQSTESFLESMDSIMSPNESDQEDDSPDIDSLLQKQNLINYRESFHSSNRLLPQLSFGKPQGTEEGEETEMVADLIPFIINKINYHYFQQFRSAFGYLYFKTPNPKKQWDRILFKSSLNSPELGIIRTGRVIVTSTLEEVENYQIIASDGNFHILVKAKNQYFAIKARKENCVKNIFKLLFEIKAHLVLEDDYDIRERYLQKISFIDLAEYAPISSHQQFLTIIKTPAGLNEAKPKINFSTKLLQIQNGYLEVHNIGSTQFLNSTNYKVSAHNMDTMGSLMKYGIIFKQTSVKKFLFKKTGIASFELGCDSNLLKRKWMFCFHY